jgi:DNA-binding response OmpR family regulator
MAAKIYVVDDERYIRAAVIAVLTEVGHEAHGFADAEEFYVRLVEDAHRPDLVIVDQMLPDEDGAQIVHSLRERPQYRDIPVLFLTAVSDEDAGRLADLAPVLRKPFDFRDLIAAVDDALARSQAAEA